MANNQKPQGGGMRPRIKGLIKIVLGLPLTGLGAMYIYNESKNGPFRDPRIGALIIGLPAVLLVVGILEVAFGMSIGQFANEWNSFPAWKQFALSEAVILGIIFVGIAVMIVLNP